MNGWRQVDEVVVNWDQPEPEAWERKVKLNEGGTFPSAKARSKKRKAEGVEGEAMIRYKSCLICGEIGPWPGARCPQHGYKSNWSRSKWTGSSQWDRISREFRETHPICAVPGCGARASVTDHIVNKARGGTDAPENLQTLCRSHHQLKTHRESVIGKARRGEGRPRA